MNKDILQNIVKYIENPIDYFEFAKISKLLYGIIKDSKRWKKMEKRMENLKERKVEYFIERISKKYKIDKNEIDEIFNEIFSSNYYDAENHVRYKMRMAKLCGNEELEKYYRNFYLLCCRNQLKDNENIEKYHQKYPKFDNNEDKYFTRIVRNMKLEIIDGYCINYFHEPLLTNELDDIFAFNKTNYIIKKY